MNFQNQLVQITDFAVKFSKCIEDEAWKEAKTLSQQWDAQIREFMIGLSAEQLITYKAEIEKIASENTAIKNKLTNMRAKVLTQIQDNKHSFTAIQSYSNSF